MVVNTVRGLYALPTDRTAKRALVWHEARGCGVLGCRLVRIPRISRRWPASAFLWASSISLGNGVDLDPFRPPPPDEDRARLREEWGAGHDDVVCGLVGRLVWEKGYSDVFGAVAALRPTTLRSGL